MYRLYYFLTAIFLCFSHPLQATQYRIPEELQKWIPWVLYEQEEKICTLQANSTDTRFCTWPSTLNLSVDQQGATFTQSYEVETKSLAPLPGLTPYWPGEVRVDKKPATIVNKSGHPAVWLETGSHTISGTFYWKSLPDHLYLPPSIGIVQLTMDGLQVKNPQLDTEGRLWFKQRKNEEPVEEESLSIQVFRKIIDGVPLRQQLHITLTVSGPPRQVTLGFHSGTAFIPLSLHSPLPARFLKENKLQVQVRPGQWEMDLLLRNSLSKSPEILSIGADTTDWKWPKQELWVFAADQKLRQVEIKGVPAVDPTRTNLPDDWKQLPAYLMEGDSQMQLVEKNRGNPSPVPNRLTLERQFWLDENGTGLTVLDRISGTMTSGWRLDVDKSLALGRVEVGGVPRLVTTLAETGNTGIEIRKGNLNIHAESRIENKVHNATLFLPAIGWQHDIQHLNAWLNLPPGWQLFSATGVDRVDTWLTRWSLLDIFLVLIITLASVKILGWSWGIVALITLTISFHQPGAPTYIWLPLLAIFALQKAMQSPKAKQITRLIGLFVLATLAVSCIPFLINEVSVGLFPQLEYGKYRKISNTRHVFEESAISDSEFMVNKQAEPAAPVSLPHPVRRTKLASGLSVDKLSQTLPPTPKLEIDPEEMIQTGPGLPNWSWKRVPLFWNGPVTPEQRIQFIFIPPLLNTILALIRVLFFILLLVAFLRFSMQKTEVKSSKTPAKKGKPIQTTAICLLVLLCCYATPHKSHAEIPSPEMLQELQDRLLAPPKCGTHCVTINQADFILEEDLLSVRLQVDSQIQTALPLPGTNRLFDTILQDQKKQLTLRSNKQGFVILRIAPGSHTITLQKNLRGKNNLSFFFPLLPAHGQATLQGWSINGLRDNGSLSQQISLKRNKIVVTPVQGREKQDGQVEVPAFIQIERTLHMGLKWTVDTRIIRKSPNSVIALDIPLIEGEHVTSDAMHVQDKHVRINMTPAQHTIVYHSSMEPVSTLQLQAKETSSWSEVWFLDVSPIWHVIPSGIPEVNQTNPAGKRFPEYHPYPGETLNLLIGRPEGVPGPTMTITKSSLEVKPGRRTTENRLTFSVTASRGMQHQIALPAGIDLQKTVLNGRELPLQHIDNKLILPLSPGTQEIEVVWRSKGKKTYKTVVDQVDLGVRSVNHSIEMQAPVSRWILFTGGPRIGPAVLFWAEVVVIFIIAFLLAKIRLTPLSFLQWLLLCLGLSQIQAIAAAIVIAWLLLLGLRKKQGPEIQHIVLFNVMQVFLAILTMAALGTILFAIQQGLLGHPDMQIGGNGSSGYHLFWYQDRVAATLPTAWILSVPLFIYRIAMLLWALWLAVALLRWLRWGWDCVRSGSGWKFAPIRKKTVRKAKQQTATTTVKKIVKRKPTRPVTQTPEK